MLEEGTRIDESPKRALWSSERAFILSSAAAAIGLGNLWRFPYMAGEQGGAAFILAYGIAILAVGLPIMVLEFALGRQSRGNTVAMFRYLNRRVAWFGWVVVGLTTIIISYYLVITGWTLGYAFDSLIGSMQPFEQFADSYRSLWFFIITTLLSGFIVVRGVSGIERFARYMMPALVVTVVGLAVYGFTLPGRDEAIAFLFSPEFARLGDPGLWLFAVGQAFYSLTVGSGYLVTYGSSLGPSVMIGRSSVIISAIETTMALLAGFMIFPIVFTFGLAPDAGSELAFNTLPVAFEAMWGGVVIGPLFFFMFFAAALSSCVGGVKVIATTMQEEVPLPYRKAVYATIGLLLLLGTPSALSFTPIRLSIAGRPFLDVMDMFAATQILVTAGLVTGAAIAWFIPRGRLVAKLGVRSRRVGHFIITVGRYLPLAVLAIFIITRMM